MTAVAVSILLLTAAIHLGLRRVEHQLKRIAQPIDSFWEIYCLRSPVELRKATSTLDRLSPEDRSCCKEKCHES
jgi:hypothetical protein